MYAIHLWHIHLAMEKDKSTADYGIAPQPARNRIFA